MHDSGRVAQQVLQALGSSATGRTILALHGSVAAIFKVRRLESRLYNCSHIINNPRPGPLDHSVRAC
jgi:hypothetical protein